MSRRKAGVAASSENTICPLPGQNEVEGSENDGGGELEGGMVVWRRRGFRE